MPPLPTTARRASSSIPSDRAHNDDIECASAVAGKGRGRHLTRGIEPGRPEGPPLRFVEEDHQGGPRGRRPRPQASILHEVVDSSFEDYIHNIAAVDSLFDISSRFIRYKTGVDDTTLRDNLNPRMEKYKISSIICLHSSTYSSCY